MHFTDAMKIERIKRWQWMLISVVVGGLLSAVRLKYGADVDGSSMNSQRQLEMGLMQDVKGVRCFKDLVVYPNPVKKERAEAEKGNKAKGKDKKAATEPDRTYYIVMGKYYSGRAERQSDGKFLAVWRPYFFVEQSPVYTPQINLAQLNKPDGPDYVKKFKAIPRPTVLDFLAIMKEAKGINYSYAWWAEPGKGTVVWMGASFVFSGLIWPSVVSLLAYGTLTPPVEEKGTDLSKVRSSTTATGPAKPTGPTEEDMDELTRMERALEEKIKASDRDAGPVAPAAVAAGPATIKQLTATKLETAAFNENKEQKEFGAKADDFYPTERTGGKPKPDQKHG